MASPAPSDDAPSSGTAEPLPLDAVAGAAGGWVALDAARRLGVLDRLADAPARAEALAEGLGLDARLTAAMLEVLAASGVARLDADGAYRVAPGTAAAASWAERTYSRLPDAWRQAAAGPRYDEPDGAGAQYPAVVGLLAQRMADVADEFAARLARPHQRVLDVGAGAAPWSLALARREPTCPTGPTTSCW